MELQHDTKILQLFSRAKCGFSRMGLSRLAEESSRCRRTAGRGRGGMMHMDISP